MPEGISIGDFVHEDAVKAFLNLITENGGESNYPFATEEYRSYYRHTLWMLPGVKEAKALSKLLQAHPVFGSGMFNIVNVAGEGDEEQDSRDALKAVREAIGSNPDDHYSITLSCGRLTTGVTVPEWTAVFMLAGSFSTSASNYLQTIFRVQTPANINGRIKERCTVFDFAPDRTLKMVAEAGHLSSRAGNISNDKTIMGEFLNFCPVISIEEGTSMKPFSVDRLLQQLKKAYTDRVVKNGFDDRHLYNDNLLKLDEIEINDFEDLKSIIGTSKQSKKPSDMPINKQGFTDEEYAEIERIENKPKKERTPEEIALLKEKKEKRDNAQKAMSILRGISTRIPLFIYAAEVPLDQDITINEFVDMADDSSWNEFMPTGVTKDVFKKFSKYYDPDIFIGAGKAIRKIAHAADAFPPMERVQKIAELFPMFKNPDKETVLTPWRVVNMHMSECLGGWCFYNEEFAETIEEPRFVDRGDVTADTFIDVDAKILEINSKTGLYPLYVTYSIFRKRLDSIPVEQRTIEKQYELWIKTIEENIFVICKTPMAKAITKRTLLGYRNGKLNAHAFDDLINQLKEKPQQFREKILRGSTWGKKEPVMKFNAVVGNPPYQTENRGDGSGKDPIYHYFIDMANSIGDISSLIHPARFLFNAGKTPKEWNEKMLSNNHFCVVKYYNDSASVFPTVDIKGGVAVTMYNRNVDFGKIGVFTTHSEIQSIIEKVKSGMKAPFSDIVYPMDLYRITETLYDENPQLDGRQSKGHRYAMGSNIFDIFPELFFDVQPKDGFDYSHVIGLKKSKRVYKYFKTNYIKLPDNFETFRVLVAKVNGSGSLGEVLSQPIVVSPRIAHSATFLSVGKFEHEYEALNLLKYIKTKFARMMLGTLKVTHDNPKKTWLNVPLQDFTDKSDIDWSKSVADIDKQLYAKYNLDDTEIAFIESMIKPME